MSYWITWYRESMQEVTRKREWHSSDLQNLERHRGTSFCEHIGVIAMLYPLRFLVWVLGGSVFSFENIPLVDVVNLLYSVECLQLYC